MKGVQSNTSHHLFWKSLPKAWIIVKLWFTGPDSREARSYAAVSLVMSLLTTMLMVKISYAQRNFSTALSERHPEEFYAAAWQFVLIIVIAAPLFATSNFVQNRLTLAWRTSLTNHLVGYFFTADAYYRIIHLESIDNVDQRICEDIASFVHTATLLIDLLVNKVLNCVAFAGVLWSVSPKLVFILVVYATGGTWATTSVFGRKLMSLRYDVLKKEADLRFSVVRVRENSESIAFYKGHAPEQACVESRFLTLVATLKDKIKWTALLAVWHNAYVYATVLVPSLVTAPRYFAGELQFGVITQAGFAFSRIEAALSIIISSLENISGLAAETERLYDLMKALEERDSPASPGTNNPKHTDSSGKKSDTANPTDSSTLLEDERTHPEPQVLRTICPTPGIALKVDNLTATTPGAVRTAGGVSAGCQIADSLNLQLNAGDSLLIVGPSGCGKSSLLRIFSGLWTSGHGTISCLQQGECCFLPQKPYMPLGTLRQQLLFPNVDDNSSSACKSDMELLQLAVTVRLPRLAESPADLDRVESWSEILSLGEQQRVAFLRLLAARPLLAFLDEGTSALDVATEAHLYEQLKSACQSYVSVGHRTQLVQYHTHVLAWLQAGAWSMHTAAEYTALPAV